MRPDLYASRPASTASFIALAMETASRDPAMAVFMSTPSQPSSIAMAASEAVPTPASTMTGTVTDSRMILMLYGLRMPSPEPIGAPSGITHDVHRRVLARAHDQPRRELLAAQEQVLLVHAPTLHPWVERSRPCRLPRASAPHTWAWA